MSFNVIFPVASVSLSGVRDWLEKTAVIQVIVLVQASHLWVKYLFFSNMMFCWFMSWSGSVQVYNRFTRDFWGYCVRVFFLKTHKVKILLIIPDHFVLVPASKKPTAFNYSTVWSSLIICSSLTNARDSLEFNIHIGKLRMPVTCFWIYWLKWDTIVL